MTTIDKIKQMIEERYNTWGAYMVSIDDKSVTLDCGRDGVYRYWFASTSLYCLRRPSQALSVKAVVTS